MSHERPVLDLVDIVAEDFEATVGFYQTLGLDVDAAGGGDEEIWHADVKFPNGASLHIDNVTLASTYNAGWRVNDGSSRVVIGFSVSTRQAVDDLYHKLTAAGHEGRQVPYDAFWGARYAIVADPNGLDIGIMSPSDDARALARGDVTGRVTADRYARPEIERRFLLEAVPAHATDSVEICDRYIDGGHLRLRRVDAPGAPTVYKLGHKHRPNPADAGLVLHTTIYLTEAEHSLLAALPARELRKTRHRVDLGGRSALVDVLHGAREGLILLEVGFEPDEDASGFSPPAWVGAETSVSGGDLAG